MVKSVLILVLLVIVFGLIWASRIFALPIDCMPMVVPDGESLEREYPGKGSLRDRVFGTKCVTW